MNINDLPFHLVQDILSTTLQVWKASSRRGQTAPPYTNRTSSRKTGNKALRVPRTRRIAVVEMVAILQKVCALWRAAITPRMIRRALWHYPYRSRIKPFMVRQCAYKHRQALYTPVSGYKAVDNDRVFFCTSNGRVRYQPMIYYFARDGEVQRCDLGQPSMEFINTVTEGARVGPNINPGRLFYTTVESCAHTDHLYCAGWCRPNTCEIYVTVERRHSMTAKLDTRFRCDNIDVTGYILRQPKSEYSAMFLRAAYSCFFNFWPPFPIQQRLRLSPQSSILLLHIYDTLQTRFNSKTFRKCDVYFLINAVDGTRLRLIDNSRGASGVSVMLPRDDPEELLCALRRCRDHRRQRSDTLWRPKFYAMVQRGTSVGKLLPGFDSLNGRQLPVAAKQKDEPRCLYRIGFMTDTPHPNGETNWNRRCKTNEEDARNAVYVDDDGFVGKVGMEEAAFYAQSGYVQLSLLHPDLRDMTAILGEIALPSLPLSPTAPAATGSYCKIDYLLCDRRRGIVYFVFENSSLYTASSIY